MTGRRGGSGTSRATTTGARDPSACGLMLVGFAGETETPVGSNGDGIDGVDIGETVTPDRVGTSVVAMGTLAETKADGTIRSVLAKIGSIFDPTPRAIVGGAIELGPGKRLFAPLDASNSIAFLAILPAFEFAIVFSVTLLITLLIRGASDLTTRVIADGARRPACAPTSAAKPAPGCNCKTAPAILAIFCLESFGLKPAPISCNLFQAMVLVCGNCSGENIEGFGASAPASCRAIISAPAFSWAAVKRAFSS